MKECFNNYTPAQSWGLLPQNPQSCYPYNISNFIKNSQKNISQLPFGNGRSYGDSCLNSAGLLVDMKCNSCFISFDEESGVLESESGVLLSEILKVFVPKGWFLPVSPGTQFVTLGGAVANDIHGKNHHCAGSFGNHVLNLKLLQSNGNIIHCSEDENTDLFFATIGGLGLTGLILEVKLKLKKIESAFLNEEIIRLKHLDDFLKWSEKSENSHEYSVAWIDCLASGKAKGRGLFMRANHLSKAKSLRYRPKKAHNVFFSPPVSLINSLSLRVFNFFYYHQFQNEQIQKQVHYEPFFYPLDAVKNWNRLYGKKGFYQYQCVIPYAYAKQGYSEILDIISATKQGSFLAVLKAFGNIPSKGILSFPCAGVTLALDFPNKSEKTLALFERLDVVVRQSGGRLYPAKDARMSAKDFRQFYPRWKEFAAFKDPNFSSDFWKRVSI